MEARSNNRKVEQRLQNLVALLHNVEDVNLRTTIYLAIADLLQCVWEEQED